MALREAVDEQNLMAGCIAHSCAAIVTPSGAVTTNGLYFFSCARPGAEIATRNNVAPVHGTQRRKNVDIMV